jgi:serine/threonine protein kinase
MTSVSLSEISFSITKHRDRLDELVKGPGFEPIWFEKLARNHKKAKSFTGNFAVTYHFQAKGHGGKVKDFGIRMWHSKVSTDDLKRYRKLNPELESLNRKSPDYIRFTPMELFEPSENGFLVKGVRHPCLKMEWCGEEKAPAANLDVFIDRIMKDNTLTFQQKQVIFRQIKQRILETGELLHTSKCSHGDLSSGNIMLSQKNDGSIKVHIIDFDSFYSDKLSDLSPSAIGHEDWQHPGYISGKLDLFGLKSDYCSLLCLVITLEGLATNLDLYDQYSPPSQDGSGILIRKKDLLDPDHSPVLRKMLDENQSLLTTYIDDLTTLLKMSEVSNIKRPKSLSLYGQVARPVVNVMIKNHVPAPVTKKVEKSWHLRKKIESEEDLVSALDGGATQAQICKALNNRKFQKKFNKNSMLKFWTIVVEHFGGINNCEDVVQEQYVWALDRAGEKKKSNELADELYALNPSNANIGYIIFKRLKNKKKWKELLQITTKALDFSPTNVNINILHSTAKLHIEKISVAEAFGDSRVRTNDDWRVLSEIIQMCRFFRGDEELCLEVFPLLIDSLNDKKVIRQVERKNNILFQAIMNFLSMGCRFNYTTLADCISLINIDAIRMCKNLSRDWKKSVIKFIALSDSNPSVKGRIGKSPDEIYHLIEILSNLAIWGTGDPDTDLCEELQYLIYSFEWLSSDDLPVAASFDTSFHNDAMIVWNLLDDNWYFSKDRLKKWESRLGNIWVKEDEQSP